MAIKEKNTMLVQKVDGFLYVIKPYTSVHNIEGAVITVNGKKPVNGNIALETVTAQDVRNLFLEQNHMATLNEKLFTYEAPAELVAQIKAADNNVKTALEAKLGESNADIEALEALVGTLEDTSAEATVVGTLKKLVEEEASRAQTKEGENASAIAALKALHAEGKTVAQEATDAANTAVTNLIYGAPEALDTLKEIADWIESDETNSANLLASINANKSAIETLNGADTVVGSVDQKIKSAVEAQDSEVEDTAGSELVSVKVVEADSWVQKRVLRVNNKRTADLFF